MDASMLTRFTFMDASMLTRFMFYDLQSIIEPILHPMDASTQLDLCSYDLQSLEPTCFTSNGC